MGYPLRQAERGEKPGLYGVYLNPAINGGAIKIQTCVKSEAQKAMEELNNKWRGLWKFKHA